MGTPLTIACVYRPGGGFSNDYVLRLRTSVAKFCSIPHRFVCLTNQKIEGIETIPFKNNWMGWWSKLELFRPGLFEGKVAYFDLDTMFASDMTDMLEPHYDFACGTNWKGPGTHIHSGIMFWDSAIDFSMIPNSFTPAMIPEYEKGWECWGDQGHIQRFLPVKFESLNERFPDRIVSYKWHVRRPGRVPEGASVVCFHGKPRPHEVNWQLPNG